MPFQASAENKKGQTLYTVELCWLPWSYPSLHELRAALQSSNLSVAI